jgi:hypothetical protein
MRKRCTWHVELTGKNRNAYRVLVGELERKPNY